MVHVWIEESVLVGQVFSRINMQNNIHDLRNMDESGYDLQNIYVSGYDLQMANLYVSSYQHTTRLYVCVYDRKIFYNFHDLTTTFRENLHISTDSR